MFISVELVQKIVKDLKDELMREAVRSIRQKRPESGIAAIAEMDGVEKLGGAISQACISQFHRTSGHVVLSFDQPEEETPTPRRKIGAKVTSIPTPVSPVRKRQKVRSISPAVGE